MPLSSSGAILYAAASELLLQPKEMAAFSAALDRVKDDPRVSVRLGAPVTGYGSDARGRSARHRVPHRVRVGADGTEHIQAGNGLEAGQQWEGEGRGGAGFQGRRSAAAQPVPPIFPHKTLLYPPPP